MTYTFTSLTIDQQAATNDPNPIALEGARGSGKTMVALYRHINNCQCNRSSLLLANHKILAYVLSKTAKCVNYQAGISVITTLDWIKNPIKKHYDEIIVIVDSDQYAGDIDYKVIKNHATYVSYVLSDTQEQLIASKLRNIFPNNRRHRLELNFRNSREIMKFVKSAFPNKEVDQDMINDIYRSGEKPRLLIGTMSEQKSAMLDILEQFNSSSHSIAILVPTQNDVDTYYALVNSRFSCSKYSSEEENCSAISNIHISTIKLSKHYVFGFDTVIIPNFDGMKKNIMFSHCSNKDYYVAMTRANENLYLLSSSIPSFLKSSDFYESIII